jgi:hypothetical protein
VSIADLIREIESLDPSDAAAVLAAVAARLATSRPEPAQYGHDRTLTAQQVAERLNMTVSWVRENSTSWLKSARLEVGGAVRYSEQALEELIRKRRGG